MTEKIEYRRQFNSHRRRFEGTRVPCHLHNTFCLTDLITQPASAPASDIIISIITDGDNMAKIVIIISRTTSAKCQIRTQMKRESFETLPEDRQWHCTGHLWLVLDSISECISNAHPLLQQVTQGDPSQNMHCRLWSNWQGSWGDAA